MPGPDQDLFERYGALQEKLVEELGPQLLENPHLAEALNDQLETLISRAIAEEDQQAAPTDGGLADLIGIGSQAAVTLEATRLPRSTEDYDEKVSSRRILAFADLYFIYKLDFIGVFRVVQKLQELFLAGRIRLSNGEGAFKLYRFDRQSRLRYSTKLRHETYQRALGYGPMPPMRGAKPNRSFHGLFVQFIKAVTQYWRDKRISTVVRERANDPSFGSVARVRRAGLDCRNNLKMASYGHIDVFRIETMQALDEAFKILSAQDVRSLFGADSAWDVVEQMMARYFNKEVNPSQHYRMAVAGRHILGWLAQDHVLKTSQTQFETLLQDIANDAEDWYTSAVTLGMLNVGGAKPILLKRPGASRRNGKRPVGQESFL